MDGKVLLRRAELVVRAIEIVSVPLGPVVLCYGHKRVDLTELGSSPTATTLIIWDLKLYTHTKLVDRSRPLLQLSLEILPQVFVSLLGRVGREVLVRPSRLVGINTTGHQECSSLLAFRHPTLSLHLQWTLSYLA